MGGVVGVCVLGFWCVCVWERERTSLYKAAQSCGTGAFLHLFEAFAKSLWNLNHCVRAKDRCSDMIYLFCTYCFSEMCFTMFHLICIF